MSDPMRTAVRLDPAEFLACWLALDLGEPPFLLRMLGPTGTEEMIAESRRRHRAALAGLAARGLSDGTRPAEAVAGPLRTFAHAEYQLDIRFTGPAGRPILGLGARHGSRGVVIVSDDGAGPIELCPVDPARVDSTLLGLLGTVRPGVATPVNIAEVLLDQAAAATTDGSVWSLADQLRALGVPGGDASAVARMLGPADFGGQLGVTVRTDGGPQRRGPWVVGFVRNPSGYVLQLRRDGTVTLAPADGTRLLRSWRELVAATG